MQHNLPSPPSPLDVGLIEVAHIYEAISYEPGVEGAIDHIDYSEDTALLSLPYTAAFVRSFAVVVQGGKAYRSSPVLVVIGTTSWTNGSLTGLTANDFIALDGSNDKPDFSESGSAIKFGFWRNHSRVGDIPVPYNQDLIIDHGIDNFSVTVHPISEVACTLEPATSTGRLGAVYKVTVTVTVDGQPVAGIQVTFEVQAGPNAGKGWTAPTDASGETFLVYFGDGGVGTDTIEASGVVNDLSFSCMAQNTWVANRAPIAVDDIQIVPKTGGLIKVLANDHDPDGDTIDVSAVTQPASGAVTNLLSSVTYTPDIRTAEGFTYTITDRPPSEIDAPLSDTAAVTVLVDCGCTIDCLGNNSNSLAFRSAYQDTVDLDLLRRFRDEVFQPTEVGSIYVDIYYNSTPEIAKILILDRPDIGSQAVRMVEMMQPALRNLLGGDGSVVFTQALIDTIGSFFANLSAAGSDSLQALITNELERVGPLDVYVGLAAKDVINIALEDSVITAVRDAAETVPADFVLEQNFPNPFNPSTQITYNLLLAAHVKLTIFNVHGQEVKTLVDKFQNAGQKSVLWKGLNNKGHEMASGVYFFQLRAGAFQETRKMILMK